jgi:hypothetical protein
MLQNVSGKTEGSPVPKGEALWKKNTSRGGLTG